MSILTEIEAVAQRASEQEFRRMELVLEEARTEEDNDALILHHSVSQREASRIIGLPEKTFRTKAQELIRAGVMPDILQVGNSYKYTLAHLRVLLKELNQPSWRDQIPHCIKIAINANKGGTAKTTTAIHLAMGLALNVKRQIRVLLIDLDPQGSTRNLVQTPDENFSSALSAMDIAMGAADRPFNKDNPYQNYLGAGYSHSEAVRASIFQTHVPGLDILTSFISDEAFNEVWRSLCHSEVDGLGLLKKYVVDELENDYDVIIMDTGPQNNAIPASALEAANVLFVPCAPRKLDWASATQYLQFLPSKLSALPSKGENLKLWRVIASNYDESHNRDREVLDYMKDASGKHLLNSVIKHSHAFEIANRSYRTVFDLNSRDCSATALNRAKTSTNDVVREVSLLLQETDWS